MLILRPGAADDVKEGTDMWACYFGEISPSYRENWTPHVVSEDEKEPDVYDVLSTRREIMYRLNWTAAHECFSDKIQVDWGGWAYKVTKAQAIAYNEQNGMNDYSIPQDVIDSMEEGKTYGIIDVEIY